MVDSVPPDVQLRDILNLFASGYSWHECEVRPGSNLEPYRVLQWIGPSNPIALADRALLLLNQIGVRS